MELAPRSVVHCRGPPRFMMRCINSVISNSAGSIYYHKGTTIVSESVQGSGSSDASPWLGVSSKSSHAALPRWLSTGDRVQRPGTKREKTNRRKHDEAVKLSCCIWYTCHRCDIGRIINVCSIRRYSAH